MNEDDMIIRMDMKRIAREKKTEAADEIERLRALALKFLDEQTEANADALRAACQ